MNKIEEADKILTEALEEVKALGFPVHICYYAHSHRYILSHPDDPAPAVSIEGFEAELIIGLSYIYKSLVEECDTVEDIRSLRGHMNSVLDYIDKKATEHINGDED